MELFDNKKLSSCFLLPNQGVKDIRDDMGAGLSDGDLETVHYWNYSPGDAAIKWEEFYHQSVMGIGGSKIVDLTQYTSKDDMKATKYKETQLRSLPHEVSGMLLYARTDEAAMPNNTYRMSGNRISVQTLDLDCNFELIAAQLDAIAYEYFGDGT